MPVIHKSTIRRARQADRRYERNRATMNAVKTLIKRVQTAVADKKVDDAKTLLRQAASAIAKAASDKPHVILLDLELPDLGGIDVARAIKSTAGVSHIPIVGCSASSDWEWRDEALRAGMVEYLQKPIRFAAIQEVIDKFMLAGEKV